MILEDAELTELQGQMLDSRHYDTLIADNADLPGVFKFVRGAIPLLQVANAYPLVREVDGVPQNRPTFVGNGIVQELVKRDGTLSRTRGIPRELRGTVGRSDTLGYIDYRERKTGTYTLGYSSWTLREPQIYEASLPIVSAIDQIYAQVLPDMHKSLSEALQLDFKISGTAFSTITVNGKGMRGACHEDSGNLTGSLGSLTTLGDFTGGHLIFPRHRIAVMVRPGDVLLSDLNEPHAVSPFSGDRVSMVLYARRRLCSL